MTGSDRRIGFRTRDWIEDWTASLGMLEQLADLEGIEVFHSAAFSLPASRELYYPSLRSQYGVEDPSSAPPYVVGGNYSSASLAGAFIDLVNFAAPMDTAERIRWMADLADAIADLYL